MKYKKILLAIILVLIGSLLGFTAAKTGLETNLQVNEMDTMHLTSFKVIGDVINVIEVEGLNQFATIEMKHRDRIMEFFSLEEVIMSAYPIVE